MLVFRIICAILMAWAVNWALSRPEAQDMLTALPEMRTLGPLAAATIGYFNLAVRQGWGFIVAFANGIWAGMLAVLLSGVFHVFVFLARAFQANLIRSFESFVTLFGETASPLFDEVANVPLLIVTFGATAIVGVVTEIVHWLLVRMRSRKTQRSNSQT